MPVFVEFTIFAKRVGEFLDDDEYGRLQDFLIRRPESGALIRGAGGLRKIRWGSPGRGKRGGVRVIYYWANLREELLMLYIYAKSEREDLPIVQLKAMSKIAKDHINEKRRV